MTWGNVALAAGAVIGGALAAEGAKDAAETGADAAAAAGEQISQAGALARGDVLQRFPDAQQDLFAGSSRAFDLFNQGLQGQQQAFGQGNVNAQRTIGQGFGNVQNALLGLPVNTEAFGVRDVQQLASPINPFGQFGGQFTDLEREEILRQLEVQRAADELQAQQSLAASNLHGGTSSQGFNPLDPNNSLGIRDPIGGAVSGVVGKVIGGLF